MYNEQKHAPVLHSLACLEKQRSKVDSSLTDGVTDILGVTRRGRMRGASATRAPDEALEQTQRGGAKSDTGWQSHSRGRGSILVSRELAVYCADPVRYSAGTECNYRTAAMKLVRCRPVGQPRDKREELRDTVRQFIVLEQLSAARCCVPPNATGQSSPGQDSSLVLYCTMGPALSC